MTDKGPGKTLSQTVADQLAEEIVRGRFQPGERLDEQSIATRFNVSRSPVRDALRQLASTRLVEYLPRRGFSVAVMAESDLDGLFEASGEVEALCAKLCALRAAPSDRKRIEFIHQQAADAVARGDSQAYAALNEEFHALIYAGARNKTLQEIALGLRQRLAPFRAQGFFVAENRLQHSHVEYEALVKALLEHDGDAAALAMHSHAANSAMNVLQHFGSERRPSASAA
ncbi:GntR family transcriptional regulator [Pigmentiphaga kullae]|uniref:DNA-binding GntR family transcriptional regulator n=1 Tax=Pigmentiphaga kullae TaxID=151784 RepID=A0A4Q7NBH1_9BURK|nr:GntR family transcriptional regulator [Pigmentiphaga kullae]RZS80286.1 DNA-binding GntR family transcriptional regulator [Pigmentiphaga kullae]